MRAVTRAMLDDMPDPCGLHLERSAGRCLVMVGSAVLSEYAESDVVMRNFAVTTMLCVPRIASTALTSRVARPAVGP